MDAAESDQTDGIKTVKNLGSFYTFVENANTVQPLWKAVSNFSESFKGKLPHDPPVLLWGIYPKELKWGSQSI